MAPTLGDTGDDPTAGLDDADREAVQRMQAVAWALDDAVRIPGTNRRIGIDPVVGVLPVGGDLVTAAASLFIVAQSALLGVGRWTLARMVANIAVDTTIGSVPLVGGLFDAAWKANERNVALAVADLGAESDHETAADE